MTRDSDARALDRMLVTLERIFRIALAVLVSVLVVGQAALLTEEGRFRLSATDRLEGARLRVVEVVNRALQDRVR